MSRRSELTLFGSAGARQGFPRSSALRGLDPRLRSRTMSVRSVGSRLRTGREQGASAQDHLFPETNDLLRALRSLSRNANHRASADQSPAGSRFVQVPAPSPAATPTREAGDPACEVRGHRSALRAEVGSTPLPRGTHAHGRSGAAQSAARLGRRPIRHKPGTLQRVERAHESSMSSAPLAGAVSTNGGDGGQKGALAYGPPPRPPSTAP